MIGFQWWLPRAYGTMWRKHSEAVFSPCKAVEDAPYALLGLAIFRIICGVPGVYLFIRPFIPVAAAHIITTAARARAGAPAASELPDARIAPPS
jgi:hypothetical protein